MQHSGKTKRSCLGCLAQLVLILVVGSILFLLTIAVFAPWGYFLGGKFHPLPYWQGWGRLHSTIAGDYVVYVYLGPSPGGRLTSSVNGTGAICTPRGEKIRLRLAGGMRRHLNLSTDGEAINLSLYHRPLFLGSFTTERRPRIEFRGKWQNPKLVMDDNGSIARAFQPDGSVYLGSDANRPYKQEVVPITLTEGSYSDFESACAALQRK